MSSRLSQLLVRFCNLDILTNKLIHIRANRLRCRERFARRRMLLIFQQRDVTNAAYTRVQNARVPYRVKYPDARYGRTIMIFRATSKRAFLSHRRTRLFVQRTWPGYTQAQPARSKSRQNFAAGVFNSTLRGDRRVRIVHAKRAWIYT